MSEIELKSCPFCGGADVKLRDHKPAAMHWVSCVSCGLEAPTETGVDAEQAVKYWNSRAEASLASRIETEGEEKPGAWPTEAQLKDATTEYLSHRGERPYRVLRGGQELWETHLPAMRAAFVAAGIFASPRPAVSEAMLDMATVEACAKICLAEAENVADTNADRYWQSKRIEGAIRKLAASPSQSDPTSLEEGR